MSEVRRLENAGRPGCQQAVSLGTDCPPPRDGGREPLFRAVYVIDVNAANATDAAKTAHRLMSDPDSQPPVLEIIDARGDVANNDLSEPERKGPQYARQENPTGRALCPSRQLSRPAEAWPR